MMSLAQSHPCTTRLALGASAPRTATARARVVVYSRKEGSNTSGIHDPVGWGQRGGAVKPHEAGLEQQYQQQAAHLAAQQNRSDQVAHPGAAAVNRHEAAQREILAVEQEKAVMREESVSDDEWAHMSAPQKWWMEAKAVLYSWLKTGVEPL